MARRQCLRLITVDETTVSSSRSSSSSGLLLLHCFAYVSVASVHRSSFLLLLPFFFCQFSLARCVPRAMSLIFSSPCSPFFFRILLLSFYFILRAQYIPFSLFDAVSSPLLPPSVSPSSSPLHSAPASSFSDSLLHRASFLLLSHTGNTRVRRPLRAGPDSTFRIVIEREHDR